MGWSKPQQDAIDIRGRNILVSAAAGSGKTAVLVERIKKLILEEGVSLDQLLVVTFSNAAASEMKERIAAALTSEIENNARNDAFLRNQMNKLNSSNISTFHAFSMEVIRRYFYLTDVAPDFRTL
jgi:ATP-dependent helicase/nuclease subunit A